MSAKYCEEVNKLMDMIDANKNAQEILDKAQKIVILEAALGLTLGIIGLTNPFTAPFTLAIAVSGAILQTGAGKVADTMVKDVKDHKKAKNAAKGVAQGAAEKAGIAIGKKVSNQVVNEGGETASK